MYAIMGLDNQVYVLTDDMRTAFDLARKSSPIESLIVRNRATGAEALFIGGQLAHTTQSSTVPTPHAHSKYF